MTEDGSQVVLRSQVDVRVQRAHAVGAQPDLGGGFLATDDQDRALAAGRPGGRGSE